MKESKIYCEYCNSEIERWGDLIVTTEFLSATPHPYHERCYAKELKTLRGSFFDKPINTGQNIFINILLVIMSIVITITELVKVGKMSASWIIILATSINLYFRVYSWLAYERKL